MAKQNRTKIKVEMIIELEMFIKNILKYFRFFK